MKKVWKSEAAAEMAKDDEAVVVFTQVRRGLVKFSVISVQKRWDWEITVEKNC